MKKLLLLLSLVYVVGCQSQPLSPNTFSQKNIALRDSCIFTDIINGKVVATGCVIYHDSANHRIVIKGTNGTSFGIPILIDSTQYSGTPEIEWLGSNNRVVADIDRTGTNNVPQLVIEVRDSSGTVNSNDIYAGLRALNSAGTKTMALISAVTNGKMFFTGRRDSSSDFHVFQLVSNDSTKLYVNGVNLIQLDATGWHWDSSSYTGINEMDFLGSAGRTVAYINRGGTMNKPSLVLSVSDSNGALNSDNVYSGLQALSGNGVKTMSLISAVANGTMFFTGRRDSSTAFNVFEKVTNDSIMLNVNGVQKWKLTSDGSIQENSMTVGTHSFTTTALADTVLITGATPSDIYLLTPRMSSGDTLSTNENLGYIPKADTLIAIRPSGGKSGLSWSWLRRKAN